MSIKFLEENSDSTFAGVEVPVGIILPWHKYFEAQQGTPFKTITPSYYTSTNGTEVTVTKAGENFTTTLTVGDAFYKDTPNVDYGVVKSITNDAEVVLENQGPGNTWVHDIEFYKIVLPENFAECNGQEIDDPESPFDGYTLPDLNGDARFLRGGSLSGTEQDDAFQGHGHSLLTRTPSDGAATTFAGFSKNSSNSYVVGANNGVKTPVEYGNGPIRIDDETRPINMSVVWIMRIK